MSHNSVLRVQRLLPSARLPTRGSALAAGYDLHCAAAATIPARGRATVRTGIAIGLPPGTYGRVAPRSGLAVKHGLDVGAGVIDADYRGELHVLLFNFGDSDFTVAEGDRIAQLILEKYDAHATIADVEDLDATERGAAGFGSTGTK